VLPFGSIIGDAATLVGFTAAMIAIGGFLGQVEPALTRKDDQAVRAATVVGGLFGLAVAAAFSIVGMVW
jgi:hypothetical protein